MRILVVGEADPSRRALERVGHEVLAASDGDEGWEMFSESSGVDVVISDWQMAGMGGPELCRRVRESARGEMVFIFLTALDEEDHSQESLEAGADGYLSKPFDAEQLRSKLEEIEQGAFVSANGAQGSYETRETKRTPTAEPGRSPTGTVRGRSCLLYTSDAADE